MDIKAGPVTGKQLSELAEKAISDNAYKEICDSPYFKEFVKILTFMQLNVKVGTEQGYFKTQDFGHTFMSYNEKKEMVCIDVDVKLTPRIMKKQ